MAKTTYTFGINATAFRKMIQSAPKRGVQAMWKEVGENTYYCDGHIIVKFKGVPFSVVAASFGLPYGVEMSTRDFEGIFNSFDPGKYYPATVSPFMYDAPTGKSSRVCNIVKGGGNACVIDERLLAPFSAMRLYIGEKLAGIRMVEENLVEVYALPVRLKAEDQPVLDLIAKGGN